MGMPVELSGTLEVRSLRRWRRKRAWIQTDLARESGHSVSTISMIERGIGKPTLVVMRDLSRALGVGMTQVEEFARELRDERVEGDA